MRNFDHSVHALVSRQISRLLWHEYWLHGLQQTANNPAPPLRCAVSCLSFFPTVNSTFLTCRCCFHTLGINDRVAWTLLAFGICSRFFYKMLQYFIPQPADSDLAVKTVYCWIRRKVLRQLTPFTPWIHQMQYRICQFSLAPYTVAHSLIQWLYFLPLFIWQVARVRLSHFFHILILP